MPNSVRPGSLRAPSLRPGFDTLRYLEDRLELLDQRVLPNLVRYHACISAAEVAEAIRTMVVRGTTATGCAAAYGIALEASRLANRSEKAFANGMGEAFALLAESRPSAAHLGWALDRMQRVLEASSAGSHSAHGERLTAEARAIAREDVANNRELGELGAALLGEGMTVLTHCNAGALATAGHGTALGVVRSAVEAGKRIAVVAAETRPFLHGARLTAWELIQDGIPVVLITDNVAGHLMSRGEIHAVLVGADRIAANGDVANMVGTYTVAVLAARHRIPFYVAAPTATIDVAASTGEAIPIEERAGAEVTGFLETRWAAQGVIVKNPAFDVTPAELVTALITERGVLPAPDAAKIAELVRS